MQLISLSNIFVIHNKQPKSPYILNFKSTKLFFKGGGRGRFLCGYTKTLFKITELISSRLSCIGTVFNLVHCIRIAALGNVKFIHSFISSIVFSNNKSINQQFFNHQSIIISNNQTIILLPVACSLSKPNPCWQFKQFRQQNLEQK